MAPQYTDLEILATAVLLLDGDRRLSYINPAAENLFALSFNHVRGEPIARLFPNATELHAAIAFADAHECSFIEHDLGLLTHTGAHLQVSCTVSPVEWGGGRYLLELQPIDSQVRIAREESMHLQQQVNRRLIRNLAHEIKNPLGGIRGAAQLLERELSRPELSEYTQVIIKEADRLQSLMDRLLVPQRLPRSDPLNVHEVLEHVRTVLLAETPAGLRVRRDYDVSLPELRGDKEQLIQAVLNIARNASQALSGRGEIIFRTRVARQVTLAKKRHRLALQLQIIDDGPGIPEALRETLFYPLVSGREGGHGLGLTLAQTFVSQHQGTIECESRPGRTCFNLLLPLTPQGTFQ